MGRSGLEIMELEIVWFELQRDKIYKVAVRLAKTQINMGIRHLPSLIKV